jgi:guanylate kinase
MSLFITITGMSGAGKGAVMRLLCSYNPAIKFLVTATTRAPRVHEQNGVHYHFMTKDEFKAKQAAGEFLETNVLNYTGNPALEAKTNFYGSLRAVVEGHFARGEDVVADLEINGVKQVFEKIPTRHLKFALLPPSREEYERRMLHRAETSGESPEDVKARMALALEDLEHLDDPDYVFKNKDMIGSTQKFYDAVFFNHDLAETADLILKTIEKIRAVRGL